MKFHPLSVGISEELPSKFTFPFCYTPHPLCIRAAGEVQTYLSGRTEWQEELSHGKMFGVLVVESGSGTVGFLAAFSGILAGRNNHSFFVPPVYDLLQPDGFFKQEEENISSINRRIDALVHSSEYLSLQAAVQQVESEMSASLSAERCRMKLSKEQREARRSSAGFTPEEEARLVRESQFQKAEYKRLEKSWKEKLLLARNRLLPCDEELKSLREERRSRSAALQLRLFGQFRFLNARGEEQDLCKLFADTPGRVPPAGAGECAAPKLLQYAYLHGFRPLVMAEFWWGESPKAEVRKHGCYYPACNGKCGPILKHMLQGLEVEENPMNVRARELAEEPETVYEDDVLLVLNKPAGMLSVPGREENVSVYTFVRNRYPDAEEPLIVHRLDMETSGLMVIAKTKEAHKRLQTQFLQRQVKKRYVALLDGQPAEPRGTVSLPLAPDLLDRPRQMVSREYGKPAVTDYELLSVKDGRALVAFYPHTGRTHQLRVHAAHPEGLACPIVGDELYGRKEKRLCLHSETLVFVHPFSGEEMSFCRKAPFAG